MLPNFAKAYFDGPRFKRDVLLNEGGVIRWWESRRPFFNLVVGCTGLITCGLIIVCAFTSDSMVGEAIGLPDGPLLGIFGIFFYGILANVFYTAGWICELLMRGTLTAERSAALGLRAFRIGVQFSIALTLCPALVCWIAFLLALLHGQKHTPAVE